TVTDRHGIVHRGRIRRLMPIECWRLQGFTDKQFRKVEALGMSDAQLYKQAGNAVTTKVIEAIGRRLKEFDEKYGREIDAVAWEKEN
ncbi:MAG: DNA cytosine methyltransferase, partial [Oscillospiraceae bacterium]|nr:DNA cytosine methyltransferase [Oscillospiraceae bacterium]